MPADHGPAPLDHSILDTVQRTLEGLKKTAEGATLYGLIERSLRKYGGDGKIEHAFVIFLHRLLDKYVATPGSDPATRVKVRMIQQRLLPFVPKPAAPAVRRDAPRVTVPSAAPEPTPTPVPPPPTTPVAADAVAEPGAAGTVTSPVTPELLAREPAPPVAAAPAGGDDTATLPEKLAGDLAEALARHREFDTLLRTSLKTMQTTTGRDDTGGLRLLLVQGISDLLAGHQVLGDRLSRTTAGLRTITTQNQELQQTLNKVRKHSLIDELTGLPNRTAFMRQLKAEIGRARRYGFSLALAIIDVDGLKAVNNDFGRAAGDAVLCCYAREIMARFRGYDLVARYGDDEFAVLLPNTQREGAAHAVEKAQKQAASTYISHAGRNIPLPSFSSVLTLYSPGEKPSALLKRADEALTHAKQRGRNQRIVTLPAD